MREDLLREVELDLQEQQRRNEETEDARRREIQENYPQVQALVEARAALIHENIFGILRGETAPENLPEQMEQASARVRQALRENGLPEDYLTPVYRCPLCQDRGYVGESVREKCECVRKRYQEKLRRTIGLPTDGRETFEAFNEHLFSDQKQRDNQPSQRDLMKWVRKMCEEWANTWPNQAHRDIVLSGKSGLGKTFLLHAMAARLIERDVNVLLISAYSFLEIARRSYFEADGRLEELISTDVLMLDDLGSEPLMQNITVEQLFNLINERQRRNLSTVISTNLDQVELKGRYTERIASRLTDQNNVLFFNLIGDDIRNGRR